MHPNSLASWRELDPGARHQLILSVYEASIQPLTDREVAQRLGFTDLNAVRPRITELIHDHKRLMECDSVIDGTTNRKVRTATIAKPRQRTIGELL